MIFYADKLWADQKLNRAFSICGLSPPEIYADAGKE